RQSVAPAGRQPVRQRRPFGARRAGSQLLAAATAPRHSDRAAVPVPLRGSIRRGAGTRRLEPRNPRNRAVGPSWPSSQRHAKTNAQFRNVSLGEAAMISVALVNMPFARLDLPSLALTQLRSMLMREFDGDVKVEIFYLNHDFASALFGLDTHEQIASYVYANRGVGA